MTKNRIFTGAGVAIVTPMNADGSVNYEAMGQLIEQQVAGGTDAIIVCGTTGESSTLTDEEHRRQQRHRLLPGTEPGSGKDGGRRPASGHPLLQ